MIVEEHIKVVHDELGEFIADGFIRETFRGMGLDGSNGQEKLEEQILENLTKNEK